MFYAGKILGNETVKRIIDMLTQIDAEKYGDLTFKERSGKWAKAA
jgi:hypothetical protein